MTTATFTLQRTLLAVALAAAYPFHGYAAPSAGVAQFIAGDVNVRSGDGKTNPLAKGNDIESGQSIVTGATGRAQVKFSDGGLISLQPNTEFKIANYSDNAANPRDERFLVDLLRGSMRAITGLIGKRNRENYKVTTNTATIGIRGSGFTAGYNPDGSLGVTTELDAIEVCNGGGCVGLTAGESVRVVNSTDAPVRTNVRASVPTPAPKEAIKLDDVNGDGKIKIVADAQKPEPTPTPTPPATDPNNGTFTNLNLAAGYFINGTTYPSPKVAAGLVTSATLANGKLTTFNSSGDVFVPTTTDSFSSAGSIANNDFIGWGTWISATKNGAPIDALHYVVGQPTAVMPTTGGYLTYTLAGSTPVTGYTSPSGPAIAGTGTLTSGSLQVDFSNLKLGVNLVTTFGSINIGNTAINLTGATFSYNSGTGIYVEGFFTGANANRAGLTYTGAGTAIFSGAAVFQAP